MSKPLLPGLILALAPACLSIGPDTVPRDRFDYSEAISESWKRQTLLNIVKLRYFDPPIFVDVGQIVSGYSLETAASAGANFFNRGSADELNLGVEGRFTDRPTITYVPLTGNRFVNALMAPIPAEAVFAAVQAGWPADALFSMALSSINGLRNEERSLSGWSSADPRFQRVGELVRELQVSGAVSLRTQRDEEKKQTLLVTLRAKDITPETVAVSRELRELLGLDPEATEFRLVFGFLPADPREIAVITRSVIHVINSLSMRTEVPQADVDAGRALAGLTAGEDLRGFRIKSSAEEPADAFVAVRYRDHWFWVDDRDLLSKRTFSFVMFLFTMTDTGAEGQGPVLTISAQ